VRELRRIKKIIAGVLALALAAAPAGIPASVCASDLGTVSEPDLGFGNLPGAVDTELMQQTTISPVQIKTANELGQYELTTLTYEEDPECKDVERIYSVYVPEEGAVTLAIDQTDTVDFSSLTLELCSDASCALSLGTMYYYSSGNSSISKEVYCPSAGTYYLKITFDREYDVGSAKNFSLYTWFVSSADRTLQDNTLVYSYSDYDNKDILYKIKVNKTGVIAFAALPVDMTGLLTGDIVLYNAKKKAISEQEYISNSQDTGSTTAKYARAFFSVKKGTYYVKFSCPSSYYAGYVLEKITDNAGKNKAKAAALKFGKAKKGAILHTDSTKKADWFKLKLTKDQAFRLVVDTYASGRLKLEVIPASSHTVITFGTKTLYTGQLGMSTQGKWKKGIYYIRVSKENKNYSGFYKLKLKK